MLHEDWPTILAELQTRFAENDLLNQPVSGPYFQKILILDKQPIRLRMDCSQNHPRAHIHVDYGKKFHSASYCIETADRLAGDLPNRYDKPVKDWIVSRRTALLELWDARMSSTKDTPIVAELLQTSKSF